MLDPFLGSGTTAIASIKTKRKFIGFDISNEYCALANERIKRYNKQIEVFEKQE